MEKINVIGVGYIGSVISLYLSEQDYKVVGIDKEKEVLKKSKWFTRFNDLDGFLDNRLENISTSIDYSSIEDNISIVCVDTPIKNNTVDLSNIKNALKDLGEQIGENHIIIIRSTLPPGSCEDVLVPLIEKYSGKKRGDGFYLCYAPEFIRGGSGYKDLLNPSKTVVSGDNPAVNKFKEIFPTSDNIHNTSIRTAEATKILDNVFTSLKVTFANETGRIGSTIDFNPDKVMEIISSDEKLNISEMYMEPGKSFGGPCLEKDVSILNSEINSSDAETPLINSVNKSNKKHNNWISRIVKEKNPDTVGLAGISYKNNFNSTENSSALRVGSLLEQDGIDVLVYDPVAETDRFEQVGKKKLCKADLIVFFNEIEELDTIKNNCDEAIDLTDFELSV